MPKGLATSAALARWGRKRLVEDGRPGLGIQNRVVDPRNEFGWT
jgi:hypothetical protein